MYLVSHYPKRVTFSRSNNKPERKGGGNGETHRYDFSGGNGVIVLSFAWDKKAAPRLLLERRKRVFWFFVLKEWDFVEIKQQHQGKCS